MQKTITTPTFKGPVEGLRDAEVKQYIRYIATTYELVKHQVGTPIEWWAIVEIERDGKSTKNEWGGFPVRNTGCPAYIEKIWKKLG